MLETPFRRFLRQSALTRKLLAIPGDLLSDKSTLEVVGGGDLFGLCDCIATGTAPLILCGGHQAPSTPPR